MPDFELIIALIYGIYALLGVILVLGIPGHRTIVFTREPLVSVILAVRNEEEHLPACLQSLIHLDYPAEKLEIIVVDDHSCDSSARIIAGHAQSCKNMDHYTLPPGGSGHPGKARALEYGVSKSKGEYIFLTDADCRVPRSWIKTLLTQFADNVGMTGGVTLLDIPGERSTLFGKIQSCDWLFLLGVAASAARYSLPLSWFGNNMAFRRAVYDECGGFAKIGHSLVEDIALLNQVHKTGRWKIKFDFTRNSLLHSSPAPDLPHYYSQRKRWARGLSIIPLPGILLLILALLAHILTIVAFLSHYTAEAFAGLALLTLTDFLILCRAAKLLGRTDLLKYIFLFEIYYFLYTMILPLLFLFDRKTNWKDRQYPVKKEKNI